LLYSIEAADNSRRDYHFDEMGNTLFVSDATTSIVASYAYTPYGKLLSNTGSIDNTVMWQGESGVLHEGNGIYYLRTRYYDSATGRFISRDPVKSISPREVNPYQYALGNPLQFVDVTGGTSVFRARLKLFAAKVEFRLAKKGFATAVAKIEVAHKGRARRGFGGVPVTVERLFYDAFFNNPIFSKINFLRRAGERLEEARERLEEARENLRDVTILHLKKILDDAREKFEEAKNALLSGSRTTTRQAALKKNLSARENDFINALLDFEDAGGEEVYFDAVEIDSVIHELDLPGSPP